jgi:hypothetical protein
VKSQGATATFDYKRPIKEQVQDVVNQTKGNIHRVFDAASFNNEFAQALFKELTHGPKLFSTTNDWSVMPLPWTYFI